MTATDTTPTTDTPLVPDFDDGDSDRKICFICSKGSLDMAYPALIMANGALGEGIETHIFFTFWGMDMINKKTMDDLHFTPLGNPAMHMPPGLGKLSEKHMPQGLGGLPGMTGMATKMMKKQIADLDVPEIPEFLEMLTDMGANLWACQMSVDMMDLDEDDLFDGVTDIINVTQFIELSEGAQVIFV
ncbi:MAG: DsrE/DsrF/DrsH-like family protein [Ilumatobacter sp.]|uniref:DsrE/DsrF/DrsH-like family protein n=1 Tax=Ilumatobacter sp. TaxID=1967498 RepID=UPI002623635E|nr:DsrE/DsrF/DrsH-like family protein [Ilumatobacter sp.]MDJ0769987.1 DsrE/DsrF/DrsH-like family protein [Ilumatobacter sp.]